MTTEWINVNDRLPDTERAVMIWNSDGLRLANCAIVKTTGERFWSMYGQDSCGCCDTFDRHHVTHWSEFPDAPVT